GIRYRNVTGVQTCALPISRRRSNRILNRRQPQALRFFLQNEPVAVLIQEQLNSLIKWPTSRHNRSHRYSAHPTRRRHKIRCHSLSHKHISYKVEIAPTARLRRTFRSYASIKSSSSRIYTGALNTMRAPAPFFAISIAACTVSCCLFVYIHSGSRVQLLITEDPGGTTPPLSRVIDPTKPPSAYQPRR